MLFQSALRGKWGGGHTTQPPVILGAWMSLMTLSGGENSWDATSEGRARPAVVSGKATELVAELKILYTLSWE